MRVSKQSASELDDEDSGFWRQLALTAGAIVALSFLAFLIYRVHYRHEMAREANSFAHTFINCSPVVADQLGTVKRVKEIEDLHQWGKKPGWYLKYDVDGSDASGVVDLRITPNPDYGAWNVPMAQLERGHQSIALR